MEIVFSDTAIKHIEYWKKTNNVKIQNKILGLIGEIQNNPYIGTGKPEPLKYELSGKWSRRIDNKHRIVYSIDVDHDILNIFSLKEHY